LAAWLCCTPVVVQLYQLREVIGYNLCQQHCEQNTQHVQVSVVLLQLVQQHLQQMGQQQ
jgi:hypothetical protein